MKEISLKCGNCGRVFFVPDEMQHPDLVMFLELSCKTCGEKLEINKGGG